MYLQFIHSSYRQFEKFLQDADLIFLDNNFVSHPNILIFQHIMDKKNVSHIITRFSFSFPLMQIEPESQTRLLDATMSMEGVLLAGVPGAGGFDAVFAIILKGAGDAVNKAWSSQGVLPLLVREDPHGVSLESSDPRTSKLTSAISSMKVN